jgi:hypothetical protein
MHAARMLFEPQAVLSVLSRALTSTALVAVPGRAATIALLASPLPANTVPPRRCVTREPTPEGRERELAQLHPNTSILQYIFLCM